MTRYTRQQRLRLAADFLRIRTSGKRWECGFFYGYLEVPTQSADPMRRMAAIASRRIGNAVERNRAKRRLRALFRIHQQRLPECCNIMLIARRSILRADFADLEARFIAKCSRP